MIQYDNVSGMIHDAGRRGGLSPAHHRREGSAPARPKGQATAEVALYKYHINIEYRLNIYKSLKINGFCRRFI